MPTFTSSRLTQSALPALNTAFPDVFGAINKAQAVETTNRGFAKEDQREKWAMQLSGGGPAAMETLMQIRFKDPDYYKDIVSTQSALIDKEAAEMGLSKDKQNMFTEDVARSLTVISELGADNPAAARAAHADMLEKYPEMNLPKDISVYASEYAGLAMTQADAEKIRGENRSEAKTKAAEQRALGLFKEKETFKAGLKKPGGGVQVEFGEEGNLRRVSVGGRGGALQGIPLSKSEAGKIKGKIVDNQILIDRMSRIQSAFRPEDYLIFDRIEKKAHKFRDKLGGPLALSAEDAAEFDRFVDAKRDIAQFASELIKEFAGSAATPAEMERLDSWLPKAGTGVFDAQSPREAERNIKGFLNDARAVQARYFQFLNSGLSPDDVTRKIMAGGDDVPTIDAMPSIVQAEGRHARNRFANAGLTGDALNAAVKSELKSMFSGPEALPIGAALQ